MVKYKALVIVACIMLISLSGYASETNEKERIEKYCREKELKINYRNEKGDPLTQFDEDGYLISLDLSGNKNLTGIKLRSFSKLRILNLSNCSITNLKESKFPSSITVLYLEKNDKLGEINLSRLPKLTKLSLWKCNIKDVKMLKLPKSLLEIDLGSNDLNNGILKNLPNLKKLNLSWCNISNFTIKEIPELIELDLSWNQELSKVELKSQTKLEKLSLWRCNIIDLKKSTLPNSLVTLDLVDNNQIEVLDLADYPNIKNLYYNVNISNIKVVLLNPKNAVHKGIAKIDYGRDKYGRILSEAYINSKGIYVNHPVFKSAKISYKYVNGEKKVKESFKAIQVNTFALKEVAFNQIAKELYPSQINASKHPVMGILTIKNPRKEAIFLNITLSSDRFETFYKKNSLAIATKIPFQSMEKKYIRVPFPFNEEFWKNTESQVPMKMKMKISAVGKSGMKSKKVYQEFEVNLQSVNKMKWDNIKNIASYGFIEDVVIVELAKSVESMNNLRHIQLPPTIDRALKAYELLRAFDISYSSMPRGSTDDEIQTPANLLMSKNKTGKCTDTTIIYATLLQRLGYSVVITTFNYKGGKGETISHLMLLIDTGIKAKDYRFLHSKKSKFFTFGANSRCYIPIETTAMTKGINVSDSDFITAWEKGLTQVSQHKAQILNPNNSFRLGSAWRGAYKPMTLKVVNEYSVPEDVVSKATSSIEELQNLYVKKHLESTKEYKKLSDNLDETKFESVFQLAKYLFTVRRYYDSKKYFEKAIQLAPNMPEPFYYYSAVLVYISLADDFGLIRRKQARKEFYKISVRFSELLINKKEALTLAQQRAMNYDLAKWFNRLGKRRKAKIHSKLAAEAMKKMKQIKLAVYTDSTLTQLRSLKWSDSLINRLIDRKISEQSVLNLANIGLKGRFVSGLLNRGYDDAELKRVAVKSLSKKEYMPYLEKSMARKYIRNPSFILINNLKEATENNSREVLVLKAVVNEDTGSTEDIAKAKDEIISLGFKDYPEDEQSSNEVKGYSEEDEVSAAVKGFSEDDTVSSATKGSAEEAWGMSK